MKLLLGKKLNMTQVFAENGTVVPVTVVRVAPGVITQVKTMDTDGYSAVQLGFPLGSKHITKPMAGHIKNALTNPIMREVRLDDVSGYTVGTKYDLSQFAVGDTVAVSGNSKGRGFQGVVKRHGFHGAPKSHGHKHDLRAPGSIGSTAPQRVFPGMRMAGHMGDERITVINLKIVKIDADESLLYINGAIPGHRNTLVEIHSVGDMVPSVSETPPVEAPEAAEVAIEKTPEPASEAPVIAEQK